MADAKEVLSRVSGLPKKEVSKIWEDVKANNKRLRDCKGPHEFVETAGAKFRGKYRCWKCGGEINGVAYSWYMEGLKHGRRVGR
jgi:predicted SprT family Zn-dependent metalloprotease